jgi:hypothetical protein
LDAAKPNPVIKANNITKIVRGTQLTSCTVFSVGILIGRRYRAISQPLIFGHQIYDSGEDGADDNPQQLIPIEKRQADPIGFGSIIKGRPENGHELDKKKEIPPTPSPLFLG